MGPDLAWYCQTKWAQIWLGIARPNGPRFGSVLLDQMGPDMARDFQTKWAQIWLGIARLNGPDWQHQEGSLSTCIDQTPAVQFSF